MTLYPVAYGTQMVSMSDLQRRFGPNLHPEFARRLWAWLESEGGKVGIGSGYRSSALQARLFASNPRRFARPGSSFHESHTWGGTVDGYAAVDAVVARGGGANHRSPTWAEGDGSPAYGLHAFIRRDQPRGEPWHFQFVETRSASAWKSAGRPNVAAWQLPTPGPTPPEPPPAGGTVINVTVTTIRLGDEGGWVRKAQSLLTTFGQDIPVDGDFGPTTDAAVRAVQAFLGLTVDGVVGPQTWGVLMNLAPG